MFCRHTCGQLIALLALTSTALGTRVILDPESEPSVQACHQVYREVFADVVYFDLAASGLLNATNLPDQYRIHSPDGPSRTKYGSIIANFSSLRIVEGCLKLTYMIPLEERNALHVYDDPDEISLAAGPQVDGSMCGLHLAYMRAMVKKHLVSIRDSREYSIFRVMHSSDGPNFSLQRGNTMFLGNYHQCIGTKLNIMRDELSKIDKIQADRIFESRQNTFQERSLLQKLLITIGPLFGYLAEQRNELFDKNSDKLQHLGMRYCMAAIRYPEFNNDSFSRRNLNFRVAICLPETCDSRSIVDFRQEIKQLIDFNIKQYYSDYYLDQLYCLPDERSELRNPLNFWDTRLFLGFNLVWLALVALSTGLVAYKSHMSESMKTASTCQEDWTKSRWWHYLSCWCLQKNLDQFWNFTKTTVVDASDRLKNGHPGERPEDKEKQLPVGVNKVDFGPMEGFKVVSGIAVTASHCVMILFSNNWNPADGHHLLSREWIASSFYLFPAIVDNFFVATGILTVGLLMRMPRRRLQSTSFWPVFIVFRYMRIVPLYALVHWFVQTYFRFIGAGPKWDYGTSRTAWISMCRNESLWKVIIPQANLVSAGKHCNHVGWYLANDIHFCLLVPLLMLIYLRNRSMGHLVVVLGSAAVCANHIWYYMSSGFDARAVFEPSMMTLAQVVDEVWAGYVMPQYRCLAFLIGMAAGQIMVQYDRDEIREWPRWFLVGGKLLILLNAYILCMMPFLLYLMPLEDENIVLIVGSVLSGLMHLVSSLAAASFIMLLCTGHLANVSHLFSMNYLRPLANMALSSLLVHIPLLYYHSQSLTYLPQVSQYNIVTYIIIICLESYALSLVVHLLFEVPIRKFTTKLMFSLLDENKMKPVKAVKFTESKDLVDKDAQGCGNSLPQESFVLTETKSTGQHV